MKKQYRICVYASAIFGNGEIRLIMPVGEPLESKSMAKKILNSMLKRTPTDTYFIIPQYTKA